MDILKKYLLLGIFAILLTSCGVRKVYTSASYGALKTYTEKPIYNEKKEIATYISGSIRNTKYPQHIENNERVKDEVSGGNFSIYRVTTNKRYNFYYGLGGSFGRYQFKSDLKKSNNDLENHFSKNDKLNYYNVNLKAGINYTKTWKKFEYSIIGFELIYANEFGSYIN